MNGNLQAYHAWLLETATPKLLFWADPLGPTDSWRILWRCCNRKGRGGKRC